MKFFAAASVVAFLAVAGPAAGEGQSIADRFRECRRAQGQAAIDACTWYLKAGFNPSATDQVFAFTARGVAFYNLHRFQEAFDDFSAALVLHPDAPDALHDHILAARMLGKYDIVLADCEAGLKADPKNDYLLATRAYLRYRGGDYAQAIADDDAALAINPKQARALYVRGLAKIKTGDIAGGKADTVAAEALQADVGADWGG